MESVTMKKFTVQYTALKLDAKTREKGIFQNIIELEREWAFQVQSDVKRAIQQVLGYDCIIYVNILGVDRNQRREHYGD